ncbi:MAG: hypothetical protein J1E00_03445 [Oscillospiraceae bacterium]|nr:hypothetical protein [Oscillospiraceae bacterium]
MERTDKVKISLAVLLVLIAVRLVLGFFPTPVEFSPYAPDAAEGELQTADAKDAILCMTFAPAGQMPRYFYRFRTESGVEGLLTRAADKKNSGSYINGDQLEIADPEEGIYNFAGRIYRLRDPEEIPLEEQADFYAQITFSDEELAKYSGDKAAAYRALTATAALDLFTDDLRTDPNPASFWVSAATMAAFCVMLAMLLKEYFGGKRKRPKGEEEELA